MRRWYLRFDSIDCDLLGLPSWSLLGEGFIRLYRLSGWNHHVVYWSVGLLGLSTRILCGLAGFIGLQGL